ncbi:hypothetical protein L1987_27588 [Smallanthus sonchifolius]|uniref:Uncharacterized protein n=1 Tax=Smallanthus sonchifolius TaxID=185202 RepID=A0ACB9ICR5_9ASTR|nr:hypothetical protein L1987_27588 [Smallanthus sonchifolius]
MPSPLESTRSARTRQSQNYQPRQQFQGTNKPSNGLSLEDAVTKLISTTESQTLLADAHHKQYVEKFSLHEAEFRTQKETLRSTEVQLGQITKLLSKRQPGCLPSNTEPNPEANFSAITLRNSKVYPEHPLPEKEEVQTPLKEIFTRVLLHPPIIYSTAQESPPKENPQPAPVNTPPIFIDTSLDCQLKKAKEINKGKKPNLGKDLNNTNWIDNYWDQQQKLTKKKHLKEGMGDTREIQSPRPKKD